MDSWLSESDSDNFLESIECMITQVTEPQDMIVLSDTDESTKRIQGTSTAVIISDSDR